MTTYLLLRSNQIQLHWRPVWPDWAIFFYFLAIHFLVKVAQISGDFLATLKASLLKGKLLWLLLSNLFGAIWLLCSLTSGQTVGDQPSVTRLGNLLTFGLLFTVCSNNAQIFRNFLNVVKIFHISMIFVVKTSLAIVWKHFYWHCPIFCSNLLVTLETSRTVIISLTK